MQVRVETLADLKRIKFNPFDTVFCVETENEYFLNLSGGSLTPDDDDIVQAIHGANARYVAMAAQASGPDFVADNPTSGTLDPLDTGSNETLTVITLTNPGGGVTLNGLSSGVPGKRVIIRNKTAGTLYVNHEQATDPLHDIQVPNNSQGSVAKGGNTVEFIYTDEDKWMLVSATSIVLEEY